MTFEEWFKQPREYNMEVYDVAKETWDTALHQAPEGYALVPIEPTEEMNISGYEAVMKADPNDEGPPLASICYRAMIKAAQESE